jgi:glycosyltransferase involved in cell wall biosynthesis
VKVLTGIPNYPDGVVMPGYRAIRRNRDRTAGFDVLRTPLFPSHDASAIGRALNYVSWAFSAALTGLAQVRAADVTLVYSSPATAALPAMLGRALFGRPYVLIVQDLWPDSVFASGMVRRGASFRIINSILDGLTRLTYRQASRIAVISPGMAAELARRGVPEAKIGLVYNWTDERVFQPTDPDPSFRPSLGIDPKDFVLMYAGNLGAAQDLGNVIRAVATVSGPRAVHLVMIGEGLEKRSLEQLGRTLAPGRVHVLPARAPEDLPALMAAADFQLVSLRDEDLFRITMPSKVQAALATGSALLVSAAGDAARLVQDARAGLTSPPGDAESLARAIEKAVSCSPEQLQLFRENALQCYRRDMASDIGSGRLNEMLMAATRGSSRTRRRVH